MTKIYFLLLGGLLTFTLNSNAQCPFFVNASASPDKVCGNGGTTTLTGTTNATNICEEFWTPTTGLSNPNSATTSATVSTSTTYTYTVKAKTNNNVVVNGDFESGNTGFTTQYTFIPPVPSPAIPFPPSYTVITSPAIINSNFPPCADHTTGTGNLLLVNSINSTNLDVWCQTVSINPSSDYAFEMWLGGLGFAAPDVSVFIDGTLLGSTVGVAGQCNWVPYNETWTNSGLSSVEICIRVNSASFFGPAFGLDDISFNEICTDTESVFVEVVEVESLILNPTMIDCNNPTANLDGSPSTSGANITYNWTTPDGMILGATNQNQAVAGAGGQYFLTVTYDDGTGFTCTDTEDVTVFENTNFPVASAVVNGTLTCLNPTLDIDGTGSSQGGNYLYNWSTFDGFITSGANTLTPTVDQSGNYRLIVTDTDSGCKDTADVFVDELFLFPTADIISSGQITCPSPTVQLDASGSSPSGVSFDWSTIDGNILSGSNTLMPTVNSSGTYQIIVTDNANGCKDTADIFVDENRVFPIADAITFDLINCFTPQINIDGTASSQGGNFTYQWSTPNGNIVSGSTGLMPLVDQQGVYQIIVTDNVGGCKDTAETFVTSDLFPPSVVIETPDSLKCGTPTVVLDGSNSDSGGGFAFEWQTTGGTIVGTTDSTHALASAPGDYFLIVNDELNGCADTADVTVFGAGGSLVFSVKPLDSVTCAHPIVTIDASESSHDSIYQFSWRTANGNFFAGDTTLTPQVNAAGDYWLRIRDTLNNCEDSIVLNIKLDTLHPEIDAGLPQTFLCSDDSIQLNAVISVPDTNVLFQWGAVSGNILSGQFSLNPWVGSSGQFLIFALDTTNGCQAVDTSFVIPDTDLPIASIGMPDTLTCAVNQVQLNASGSDSGNGINFMWNTPDGNFAVPPTDLQPFVNSPGTYVLSIENTGNGCENSTSIEVFENLDTPMVFIPLPDTINCADEEVILTSFLTGSSQNLTFSWTTPNGNILGATNDLSATVNMPGKYFLETTNTSTGCVRLLEVDVAEKKIFPDVSIALPDTINCINSEINLTASVSNTNGFFIYQWQPFPDGNIVGDADLATIRVDSAGTYLVRGIETSTGCLSERLVIVEDNFTFPSLSLLPTDSLNCLNDSIRIDGVVQSSQSNLRYNWTTADGAILGSTDSLFVFADEEGTYNWSVTNLNSGCVSDTSVLVSSNRDFPMINISTADTLGCTLTPILLDANGSSFGADFQLNWSTSTGNIISGATTLTPEINAPGDYYLEILNTANGCETLDSVNVVSNSSITGLAIQLSGSDTLNCFQPTLTATTLAGNFDYVWTNAINPTPGNWTETAIIDSPGIITVELTDPDGCKGQSSIEIFENFAEPVSVVGTAQQLSCTVDSLFLTGSGSMGTEFSYEWTTLSGNIRSGQNTQIATVGSAGIYYFTVQNIENGCQKTDSVEVTASTDLPFGFIQPAPIYTCVQKTFSLDASTSDTGAGIQYIWTTTDGNIVSGSTGLMPEVNQPGTYFLEILNTNNNCRTRLNTEVQSDTLTPPAEVGLDTLINCYNPAIRLFSTVNSPRTDFRFAWQTTNGNIIADADTNQPLINASGNYNLLVTDLVNGCEESLSLNVSEDFDAPISTPLTPNVLTCSDTIVGLEIQVPGASTDYDFIWTTTNGRLINPSDTSFAQADIGGDFQVEIIQLSNGCRDTVDIQILESKQLPNIAVRSSPSITCDSSTIFISGAGSSTGASISYQWTTSSGQIISPTDELNAVAAAEGVYTLTVRDAATGCRDTASVLIQLDTMSPILDLVFPDTITCDRKTVILEAALSSVSNPQFSWTTLSGNIISGTNTDQISVNQSGIYYLLVENSNSGCATIDSVLVAQNDSQPLIQIETPEMLSCSQNQVQLDATGSTSGGQFVFQWTTDAGSFVSGENGMNPFIDSAGVYVFSIKNFITGCEGIDSVEVLEIPNTLVDLLLSETQPGCEDSDGSIQIEDVLGGVEPYQYSIDSAQSFTDENLFENLPEGSYQLAVRDSNGCVINAQVDLMMPDSLLLSGLSDLILAPGTSQQIEVLVNRDSNEIALIEWTPANSLSCLDCLNPELNAQSSETYSVIVQDINGCEATLSFSVETTDEIEVFFPSGFSPNGDNFNDKFTAYAAPGIISKINTFQIYDRWGNHLFQVDNADPLDPDFGWNGEYKGQKMNSGVYIFFTEIELVTGEVKVFKGDVTLMEGNN